MKKIIRPCIFFVVFLLANFIIQAQDNTLLFGQIKKFEDAAVYLYTIQMEEEKQVTTTSLQSFVADMEGEFRTSFKLKKPTLIQYKVSRTTGWLFLAPGDTLKMNLKNGNVMPYFYKGDHQMLSNVTQYIYSDLKYFYSETSGFYSAELTESDTAEFNRSFDQKTKKFLNKVEKYTKGLSELDEVVEIVNTQVEDWTETKNKELIAQIEMQNLVSATSGFPGLDIKGIDLNGDSVHLSQFKGKPIVIDFWGTYCLPCLKEIPDMAKLKEKYAGKVNFVPVALGSKPKDWKSMSNSMDLGNGILIEKGNEAQLTPWRVKQIPRYVILDANFKVVDINAPRPTSGDMDEILDTLLQ